MTATETLATDRRGTAEGREFVLLITLIMGLGALGVDLLLPAFADMRVEYGMPEGSPKVAWLVTAYFLGLAVGPWFFGPTSDRFGRKPVLFIGLAMYTAGALLSVFSPSFGWLVVARFVWGIGAGAPRSLSMAMIRDRYEGEQMARLLSLIMAIFILIPILAPALGAGLMLIAPWRIVFWVPCVGAVIVALWSRRLPETLNPAKQRPFTAKSVAAACRAVVGNRRTRWYGAATMFLFGILTTYLSSSEFIIDEVYGLKPWFPLFFGGIATLLGVGSLTSARFVGRFGLERWIALLSRVAVGTSLVGLLAAFVFDGKPSFWLFTILVAVSLPLAQALVPNLNTGAMIPMGEMAGTAAAVLGTVSVAGGALLGNLAAGQFEGTVRPYSIAVFAYALAGAGCVALAHRSETVA